MSHERITISAAVKAGGRFATVSFTEADGHVEITVTFDPESQNPTELQRAGWQAILDNFKQYTESI